MCGQEGRSSRSSSQPQWCAVTSAQFCRASHSWCSYIMQQSWSHGLLPPKNSAKLLPLSSSHFLFFLICWYPFFASLVSWISSSYSWGSDKTDARGGNGLKPGRDGGHGEYGATFWLWISADELVVQRFRSKGRVVTIWPKLVISLNFTPLYLDE